MGISGSWTELDGNRFIWGNGYRAVRYYLSVYTLDSDGHWICANALSVQGIKITIVSLLFETTQTLEERAKGLALS